MSSPTGMCRPAVSEPHPARAPMARKTLRSMRIRAGMIHLGPPVSAPAAPAQARCPPRARARWRGLPSWPRLVAAASDYCNFGWLAGPAAGISKERCSAALRLLPAVPPALSGRAGRVAMAPMKSSTTASDLSAGAMATGCADGRSAARRCIYLRQTGKSLRSNVERPAMTPCQLCGSPGAYGGRARRPAQSAPAGSRLPSSG
jgi:hypothetical protein